MALTAEQDGGCRPSSWGMRLPASSPRLVRKSRPGSLAIGSPSIPCCTAVSAPRCRSGETNLCTRLGVLGVTHDGITRNGAFADYVSVPGHILHRLPDSVSFIEAAMVEPLTVAYHAATRFPAPQDGVAAVIGVGTIGLLLVQVLKSLGVRTVVAVDIAADRLQTALANGADAAVDAAAVDARAQVLALAGSGAGVDAVYDATGIETTVNFCLSLLRTGGRCTLIGNLSPEIKVPLQQIVTRQLSLYGSYASAGAYPDMPSADRHTTGQCPAAHIRGRPAERRSGLDQAAVRARTRTRQDRAGAGRGDARDLTGASRTRWPSAGRDPRRKPCALAGPVRNRPCGGPRFRLTIHMPCDRIRLLVHK